MPTKFEEERERRIELKRIKRLTALSVLAILLGCILVLSGCASTSLLAEAQACAEEHGAKSPLCEEAWERWNKNEERLLRRNDESKRAEACRATGSLMVCETSFGEKRCACAGSWDLERIFGTQPF